MTMITAMKPALKAAKATLKAGLIRKASVHQETRGVIFRTFNHSPFLPQWYNEAKGSRKNHDDRN